jgi:recombinational DNA repair protein (RecF pathway)
MKVTFYMQGGHTVVVRGVPGPRSKLVEMYQDFTPGKWTFNGVKVSKDAVINPVYVQSVAIEEEEASESNA